MVDVVPEFSKVPLVRIAGGCRLKIGDTQTGSLRYGLRAHDGFLGLGCQC
jgi:hypothetical protein